MGGPDRPERAPLVVAASSGHPGQRPVTRSAQPIDVELVGWRVRSNPNATLTITLRDPHLFDVAHPRLVDADRLRATLARAGVPVVLEFHDLTAAGGATTIDCHVGPDATALTERVVVSSTPGVSSWVITIRPAALPPNAVLQLFLAPERTTEIGSGGAVTGHGIGWNTAAVAFPRTPAGCTLTRG